MVVLFCRPGTPQEVDDRFELEQAALDELEVPYREIAMEHVVDDALERSERLDDEVLYRGWMLSVDEYARLDEAVSDRGGALVTTPEEYEAAHYLPSWYDALGSLTVPTRWTGGADVGEAWDLAQELGPPPYVLKDHVKSVKEQWDEACFVPAGADRAGFARICEAMIDARGDRFERGIVIRRYVALAPAPGGEGARDEHRLFFWRAVSSPRARTTTSPTAPRRSRASPRSGA